MTRLPVLAAALSVLALAGCGTASSSSAPASSPRSSLPAIITPPAPSAPVAASGQTVTFSWPDSSAGGHATTWKMTVLGVRALSDGPLSGQPSGYRDFCLDLKFALTGTRAYALLGGQLNPQWTWQGNDGQVIGESNTGAPAFDAAACQDLFPGSEDIAAAVTAPAPGEFVTGSEAFSVPPGVGILWLEAGNGRQALAGIRY
jgi:hypothetical protein